MEFPCELKDIDDLKSLETAWDDGPKQWCGSPVNDRVPHCDAVFMTVALNDVCIRSGTCSGG